jgi:penicillin amidase
VSVAAQALLPHLTALAPSDEDDRWVLELLAAWDGDQRADSAAAAIYNVWLGRVASIVLGASADRSTQDRYHARREAFVCLALPRLLDAPVPAWIDGFTEWDPVLRAALRETLETLGRELGPDRSTWRWGALHRVRFAHPLARMPGLGPQFVAAEHEVGGDEQTILQASFDSRLGFDAVVVPSWRLVADLADVDRSQTVLTTGQSGNPVSPHWNDQASLWISGTLRPAPVTRSAVESAMVSSLTLEPAG